MDTLKILVVDDESRMRKLVKDFLTKKNFQVLEAGDGEEAMDIFYKEKDISSRLKKASSDILKTTQNALNRVIKRSANRKRELKACENCEEKEFAASL